MYRSVSRRAVTLVAGVSLGLVAVGVAASPASAHYAQISGTAVCKTSTGKFEITWKVTNDYPSPARLDGISAAPDGTSVSLPSRIDAAPHRGHTSVTGVQTVPGDSKFGAIRIDKVRWEDGHVQRDVSGGVRLDGNCRKTQPPVPPKPVPPKPEPPKPQPSPPNACVPLNKAAFTHKFDGAAGTASVTLTGKKLCGGKKQPFSLISYTQPPAPGGAEKKFDSATGTVSNQERTTSLKVKLPPCGVSVYLVWGDRIVDELTAQNQYGDRILGSPGKPGSQSEGPLGRYAGPRDACTDKPEVSFSDSCEGVGITLINRGAIPAQFFGESKVGDGPYKPFDKPVTVAPGAEEKMSIKGSPGLTVRVTAGSTVNAEHRWSAPANCTPPASTPPSPPPPGGGSGTPSLPVTGVSLGLMIAGALAATGAGVALVMLSRKRRRTVSALAE
jgi:hypothetical protein